MRTALLLLALATTGAQAHDHWINRGGYQVPVTAPGYTGPSACCGENHCRSFAKDDVEERYASFYIKSLREEVPMSEVKWGTPDGRFWRCANPATPALRDCFFAPGPGT